MTKLFELSCFNDIWCVSCTKQVIMEHAKLYSYHAVCQSVHGSTTVYKWNRQN